MEDDWIGLFLKLKDPDENKCKLRTSTSHEIHVKKMMRLAGHTCLLQRAHTFVLGLRLELMLFQNVIKMN